ncbi:unnamed protein product [Ceratitis capitata]|uniref:(Mediterranean fruit fly) hypothetical protein n=1 Tax=Ceratitis capitata TaxID=7213 RepID=A0A811U2A7_CERCA|nr:unnamed protein product [Ceratitis capitata]
MWMTFGSNKTAVHVIEPLKREIIYFTFCVCGVASGPCDLTPLDYCLCGYVKPLIYADKHETVNNFEGNTRRFITDMRHQLLQKVVEILISRLEYICSLAGNYF